MTLFGTSILGFITALGITTFCIETFFTKTNKKDFAMWAGIVGFLIAFLCGLSQFNVGLEAIKEFALRAMF